MVTPYCQLHCECAHMCLLTRMLHNYVVQTNQVVLKIADSETVPLMKHALFSFQMYTACKCYVIISII